MKVITGTPYQIDTRRMVGKGTFGAVYEARDRDRPGLRLACKVQERRQREEGANPYAINQVRRLKQIPANRNIVQVYQCLKSRSQKVYLIMELCDGSLADLLKARRFAQQEIIAFLCQFINGYRELYRRKLIHRDLKPDNILTSGPLFKLSDLGLAAKLNADGFFEDSMLVGTMHYIAPQLYQQPIKYSPQSDMFALGVMLYHMLYGSPYYKKCRDQRAGLEALAALTYDPIPGYGDQLPGLVKRMMSYCPKDRLSWEQLFAHPLVSDSVAASQFQVVRSVAKSYETVDSTQPSTTDCASQQSLRDRLAWCLSSLDPGQLSRETVLQYFRAFSKGRFDHLSKAQLMKRTPFYYLLG